MASNNIGSALTVYELLRGKPFEWYNSERRMEADKYLRQIQAAARLIAVKEKGGQTTFTSQEIRGQAQKQALEYAKLTLVDFLEQRGINVSFERSSQNWYSFNTHEVFIPLKVFDLIEVLKEYPYPPAFGTKGLDLNSIRIAEGKGGCVLGLEFFGKACTIFCSF